MLEGLCGKEHAVIAGFSGTHSQRMMVVNERDSMCCVLQQSPWVQSEVTLSMHNRQLKMVRNSRRWCSERFGPNWRCVTHVFDCSLGC